MEKGSGPRTGRCGDVPRRDFGCIGPGFQKHPVLMDGYRRLVAYRSARFVSLGCFTLARTCWAPWASAVFSQLQRSALSVQLNIAEGWSFGDSPTYTRHLAIAHGSAVETAELLSLAADLGLVEAIRLSRIRRANEVSRLTLLGLLKVRRPF